MVHADLKDLRTESIYPIGKIVLETIWEVSNGHLSCSGSVSGCGSWSCQDDWGRAGLQHSLGCELPGVSAEEELAERQSSLHQEYHGKATAPLLETLFHNFSINKCGVGPNLVCFCLS